LKYFIISKLFLYYSAKTCVSLHETDKICVDSSLKKMTYKLMN